jgi:hypothetical protein
MDRHDGLPMICRIQGEWRAICKARCLVEGVTLKFGARKPSANTVVYIKISPLLVFVQHWLHLHAMEDTKFSIK